MNYDPKGFIGGVYGGYDRQFDNNVVLGGEVDFAGGDVKGDSLYYVDDNPVANNAGQAKLRWSGAVRARLGYAVDRFLPYLAGGVAFASYEYGAGVSHSGHYDSFSASDTRVGWTVGAGIEYAFSDNLIGRFEYRYADFGSKTLDVAETGAWAVGNKVDLKTNDIRVGIAYRF
jgi:outer membrane immunogenic protein